MGEDMEESVNEAIEGVEEESQRDEEKSVSHMIEYP